MGLRGAKLCALRHRQIPTPCCSSSRCWFVYSLSDTLAKMRENSFRRFRATNMLCLQFISRTTTVMIPSHSLSVYHNIFLLDYKPVKNENDETKGNVQCLS